MTDIEDAADGTRRGTQDTEPGIARRSRPSRLCRHAVKKYDDHGPFGGADAEELPSEDGNANGIYRKKNLAGKKKHTTQEAVLAELMGDVDQDEDFQVSMEDAVSDEDFMPPQNGADGLLEDEIEVKAFESQGGSLANGTALREPNKSLSSSANKQKLELATLSKKRGGKTKSRRNSRDGDYSFVADGDSDDDADEREVIDNLLAGIGTLATKTQRGGGGIKVSIDVGERKSAGIERKQSRQELIIQQLKKQSRKIQTNTQKTYLLALIAHARWLFCTVFERPTLKGLILSMIPSNLMQQYKCPPHTAHKTNELFRELAKLVDYVPTVDEQEVYAGISDEVLIQTALIKRKAPTLKHRCLIIGLMLRAIGFEVRLMWNMQPFQVQDNFKNAERGARDSATKTRKDAKKATESEKPNPASKTTSAKKSKKTEASVEAAEAAPATTRTRREAKNASKATIDAKPTKESKPTSRGRKRTVGYSPAPAETSKSSTASSRSRRNTRSSAGDIASAVKTPPYLDADANNGSKIDDKLKIGKKAKTAVVKYKRAEVAETETHVTSRRTTRATAKTAKVEGKTKPDEPAASAKTRRGKKREVSSSPPPVAKRAMRSSKRLKHEPPVGDDDGEKNSTNDDNGIRQNDEIELENSSRTAVSEIDEEQDEPKNSSRMSADDANSSGVESASSPIAFIGSKQSKKKQSSAAFSTNSVESVSDKLHIFSAKLPKSTGRDFWLEVFCSGSRSSTSNETKSSNDADSEYNAAGYITFDCLRGHMTRHEEMEREATTPLVCVTSFSFDSQCFMKDLTSRYAAQRIHQNRKVQIDRAWWAQTLAFQRPRRTCFKRMDETVDTVVADVTQNGLGSKPKISVSSFMGPFYAEVDNTQATLKAGVSAPCFSRPPAITWTNPAINDLEVACCRAQPFEENWAASPQQPHILPSNAEAHDGTVSPTDVAAIEELNFDVCLPSQLAVEQQHPEVLLPQHVQKSDRAAKHYDFSQYSPIWKHENMNTTIDGGSNMQAVECSADRAADEDRYEFIYPSNVDEAVTRSNDSSLPEKTSFVTLTPFVPNFSTVLNTTTSCTTQNADTQQTSSMVDMDEDGDNNDSSCQLKAESPQWGNSLAADPGQCNTVASSSTEAVSAATPPPLIDADFVAVLADLGIDIETDFQPGRNNRVLNTINAITHFKTDVSLSVSSKAAVQLIPFDEHIPTILQQTPVRKTAADGAEFSMYFMYEVRIQVVPPRVAAVAVAVGGDADVVQRQSSYSYRMLCAGLLPKLPAFTIYSSNSEELRVTLLRVQDEPQKFSNDELAQIGYYHRHLIMRQDFQPNDPDDEAKSCLFMPPDQLTTADENDYLLLLPIILHRIKQLLTAEELRRHWAVQIGLNLSDLSGTRDWPALLGRSVPPERQEALYGNNDDVDFFKVGPSGDAVCVDAAQAEPPKSKTQNFYDECAAAMATIMSQVTRDVAAVGLADSYASNNVEISGKKRTISMLSTDDEPSPASQARSSLENLTLLSQVPPLLSVAAEGNQVPVSTKRNRRDEGATGNDLPATQAEKFNPVCEPLVIGAENSQISLANAAEISTIQQVTPPASAHNKDYVITDGVRRRILSHAVQNLIAQHHFDDPWFCDVSNNTENDVFQRANVRQLLSDLRGPHPGLVLQTLTAKSARDHFNFERLEMVGDSALNLFISVYLFARFPEHDQGKLMFANHVLVSNKLLFMLAQPHGIGQRVVVQSFPSIPGCNIGANRETTTKLAVDADDEIQASQISLGASPPPSKQKSASITSKNLIEPKVVSDCVEALIGAYLVSSGPFVARLFMHAFGITVFRFPPVDDDESAEPVKHRNRPTVAEIVDEFSRHGLDRLIGLPNTAVLPDEVECAPELLVPLSRGLHKLEAIIGYAFRDKSFLVQALTHQSFMARNHVTGCYERLEVLGDALVDYLVTVFIYRRCPHANPAKIHLIRKNLVGNEFFAFVVVRNRMYSFLKLSCKHPTWRKMITFAKHVLKPIDAANLLEKQKAAFLKHAEEKLCCDLSKPLTPGGAVADKTDDCSTNFADESLNGTFTRAKHILCGTKIVDVLEVVDDAPEEKKFVPTTLPPKCLGDMLESIAGAIYVDSGGSLDACWRYLCHIMGDELIARTTPKKRDMRRRTLRKTKRPRRGVKSPVVRLGNRCGGAKNIYFYPLPAAQGRRAEVVVVLVNRRIGFCGVAATEEVAREAAAQCALEYLDKERLMKQEVAKAAGAQLAVS